MAHTYSNLLIHALFSTEARKPSIGAEDSTHSPPPPDFRTSRPE